MIPEEDAARLEGVAVLDTDGHRIGRARRVHRRVSDGTPIFVAVHAGLLPGSDVVVPLEFAALREDGLHIGFPRAVVEQAPHVPARHEVLDEAEEDAVHAFYGMHSRAVSLGSDNDADRSGRVRNGVDDHPHGDTGLIDLPTAARPGDEERDRGRAD